MSRLLDSQLVPDNCTSCMCYNSCLARDRDEVCPLNSEDLEEESED